MGTKGQLRRFFRVRREGLEIYGARRPSIEIPEDWQVDYVIMRLLKGGLGVTLRDLNDWRYTWEEIWQMHDMLDLNDWVDWQSHVAAEAMRGGA